ncbi:hypothetical protein IW261DRAFT_1558153 [Armillaria novae-zelandiae]|uniref:Uncharacterized protein n=1 Tax=Armillaria novae-zelandiae TaxID=153914 RepID=A0AA39UFE9_9AGAR|nr:hypothetical protein IW261DRAFT_1558153 [Armillaria novae-zelandiae]
MHASSQADNPYNFGTSQKSAKAAKRANLMGSNTEALSSKPAQHRSSMQDTTPEPLVESSPFDDFPVETFHSTLDEGLDDTPQSPSPPPTTADEPVPMADEPTPGAPALPHVCLLVHDTLRTINTFGIWREYSHCPSYDPDAFLQPEDLTNSNDNSTHTTSSINPDSLLPMEIPSSTSASSSFPPPWPFPNMTHFKLMSWVNNGHNQKSEAEVDKLVNDVILSSHFNQDDLTGF